MNYRIPFLVKAGFFILLLNIGTNIYAQKSDSSLSYEVLMKNRQYEKAKVLIESQLKQIYLKRIDYRIVPGDYISIRTEKSDIDLIKLFKKRKIKKFFIEDNPEISNLHRLAGFCSIELKEYDDALNHLFQSLRYKKIEPVKDQTLLYRIAQVYKATSKKKAYERTLEVAYGLNSSQKTYALELGLSLRTTPEIRRSAHYLEQYLETESDRAKPEIYLILASLFEDLGKYLKTAEYYKLYLQKKPKDGVIHFALGVTALNNTGDYRLSKVSFSNALQLLPKDDIFRISKSYEYLGDILRKELHFKESIESYQKVMQYQTIVKGMIDKKKGEVKSLRDELQRMQSKFYKDKSYDEYEEYEFKRDEKGKIDLQLQQILYEYNRLNAGKVRWFTAYCFERLEQYEQAIGFYREAIRFEYRSNDARKKIVKLRLILKRGY